MSEKTDMVYVEEACAHSYKDWSSCSLFYRLLQHVNQLYFGDLNGARVVDFGCGNGLFLKKCLASGASFCLGLDCSESMITAGGNTVMDKETPGETNEQLRFAVQDIFKPIEQNYGQFDFALCHYPLHNCSSEAGLKIFFNNAIEILKPGGKLFIGQAPYVAYSSKDQDIVANLCGFFPPLRSDSSGDDPYSVDVQAFRPAATESGRPFTRIHAFSFSDDYHWSTKKLMSSLEKAGFVKVTLLPPTFPDGVNLVEKEQLESLHEPFIFIGAEKP